MTDKEEFAARSQLKWTRDGDAWILLYRRRRMGRVILDTDHPGMWRSVKVDGILSDMANLSWSKDAVLAQAAREVAYERANTPSQNPSKTGGLFPTKIVAHSFKRGLGIRMADYAHSGGHSHRHCPLTTPRLVAATFAASLQVFCLAGSDSEKFWASAKALRMSTQISLRRPDLN